MSTSGLCCGQWSVSVHQWVVLWSVECKCPPVGMLWSVLFVCFRALEDARRSVDLEPLWPKAHFRLGRALAGLKVWYEHVV